MALVTVQRSPSPSATPDNLSWDLADGGLDADSSVKSNVKNRNLSESYLSFKGAALILPQSECQRSVTKGSNTDIHTHLQSMFYLLRPLDTIKMAIKLESVIEGVVRYMAVVSTVGVQDTEECIIVGVDMLHQEASIGLVLPVWADMTVKLDGDGGFTVTTNLQHHIFKPVSVQAMWSAWQCLNKIHDNAQRLNYYTTGLTHTWVQYYEVTSSQECINEWNLMEDVESQRTEAIRSVKSSDVEVTQRRIRNKLKEIMMTVDLEEVTSLYLRKKLEESLKMGLKPYKQFIDEEMIIIMRQMESSSQIFDFLYLGSEWNASNLEELNKNKIGYILNVTREIDNFFPGMYTYKNIRVFDVDEEDLLKHWEETYRFICKARKNKSRVLVHCKMGVSRSASSVISFAMKDNNWSLDQAYSYVKNKRSVIRPNDGFMKQLKVYEGILEASNQRNSQLWRSASVGNLARSAAEQAEVEEEELYKGTDLAHPPQLDSLHHYDSLPSLNRPQSWSPQDDAADILLKAHGLASREESSDESMDLSDVDDYEDAMTMQFKMDADQESSSQSHEDIDEAFHELIPEGLIPEPVVLINRFERKFDNSLPETSTADEDYEEGVQSEGETKHVFSGYDVSVLEAMQDEAFAKRVAFNEELSDITKRDKSEVFWSAMHMHPDIISELTIARYRKLLRLSHFMQLQKKSPFSTSTPQLTMSKSLLANQTPSANIRVKPDDFWIKEGDIAVEPPKDGSTDTVSDVVPESKLSQSAPDRFENTPSLESSNSDIIPTYVKEAIPWSPGTVRRQAQDLEGRMTTAEISGISELSSSPCRMSNVQSLTDNLKCSSGSATSDGKTCDVSPSEPFSDYHCDGSNTVSASTSESSSHSSKHRRGHSSSNIYQSEEISLQPGHVLRTKLEIEHRERSSSFNEMSPDKEFLPVQRSSSCRISGRNASRNRFDRSSERRKTCLPVLNIATCDLTLQVPRIVKTSDKNEILADDKYVVTYKIGEDAIEIEEGKVKRQTKDFEEVSAPIQKSHDKEEDAESNTIVLEEGEVLIRQGSVKRTKMKMIRKYSDINSKGKSNVEELDHQESKVHRELKHSFSSPQLSLGAPAYPKEDEITWSIGTVRQHKESYEKKDTSKELGPPERKFGCSLSDETLTLIRQVGTAWSQSPKSPLYLYDCDTPNGPGLVRRLADQIQGQSISEQIERRLQRLHAKGLVKKIDFSEESVLKSSIPRSASLRESSPRLRESNVSSQKDIIIKSCLKKPNKTVVHENSKSICDKNSQILKSICADDETPESGTNCLRRTSSIKEARKYFESGVMKSTPKTELEVNASSPRISSTQPVFKSTCNVTIKPLHIDSDRKTEVETTMSSSPIQETAGSDPNRVFAARLTESVCPDKLDGEVVKSALPNIGRTAAKEAKMEKNSLSKTGETPEQLDATAADSQNRKSKVGRSVSSPVGRIRSIVDGADGSLSSRPTDVNVRGLLGMFEISTSDSISASKQMIPHEKLTKSDSLKSKKDCASVMDDSSADVMLNPQVTEMALKTLFTKEEVEGKMVAHVGVKGTRRHRRTNLTSACDHNQDEHKMTSTTPSNESDPNTIPKMQECELNRDPPRSRKSHGKTHPLSHLTQPSCPEDMHSTKTPVFNAS